MTNIKTQCSYNNGANLGCPSGGKTSTGQDGCGCDLNCQCGDACTCASDCRCLAAHNP